MYRVIATATVAVGFGVHTYYASALQVFPRPPVLLTPNNKNKNPLNKLSSYLTGKIASDERGIFFPTEAHRINGTHWNVPIHGWIFEPETESRKRKAFIKISEKILRFSHDETKKRIFKRRIMPFTVDNKSLKFVRIQMTDTNTGRNVNRKSRDTRRKKVHRLSRSAKDGHFFDNLILHENEMDPDEDGIVTFQTTNRDDDDNGRRKFTGQFYLIPERGLSVISDIDDTVKITESLNKKELYKNTFLREFKAVDGMVELYQQLAAAEAETEGMKKKKKQQQEQQRYYSTCSFHYVSASPYQLYEELHDFLIQKMKFPNVATFHLTKMRVKDKTLLDVLLKDPKEYKIRQIEPILNKYPDRKFVFVGDSGQKDIDVYKHLYQKYPSQVCKIWIRNIDNSTEDRFGDDDDFNGNINNVWQYFSDGTDIDIDDLLQ